jgi:hypothetical protein
VAGVAFDRWLTHHRKRLRFLRCSPRLRKSLLLQVAPKLDLGGAMGEAPAALAGMGDPEVCLAAIPARNRRFSSPLCVLQEPTRSEPKCADKWAMSPEQHRMHVYMANGMSTQGKLGAAAAGRQWQYGGGLSPAQPAPVGSDVSH